jgi:hypothetical protein
MVSVTTEKPVLPSHKHIATMDMNKIKTRHDTIKTWEQWVQKTKTSKTMGTQDEDKQNNGYTRRRQAKQWVHKTKTSKTKNTTQYVLDITTNKT